MSNLMLNATHLEYFLVGERKKYFLLLFFTQQSIFSKKITNQNYQAIV